MPEQEIMYMSPLPFEAEAIFCSGLYLCEQRLLAKNKNI